MKKSKLLPVIGIVLFVYILTRVDIAKVIDGFSRINFIFFGITIVILAAQHPIKALRWKILVDSYGIKFPLIESLRGWMIGYSLSLITPGKVGDFARAYYLKGKLETGKALTSVMADRVIDVFVLFVFAIIGISIFVTNYVKNDFLLFGTYTLFALFVAAIFIFSKKSIATTLVRPFYYKLTPQKYKKRAKKVYNDFYSGIEILFKKKRAILVTTLITIAFWFVSILGSYTLAIALGLNVSYMFLLIINPIVLIILALPISFSGIGTRDATLIFFFSYLGLTAEVTLSYSIMNLILDYVFAIFGFGLFFKNPIKMSKEDKE